MTNVGYATLSVIPSLKGFRSSVTKGTTSAMSGAGTSAGRSFSGAFTKAAKIGVLGGLGAAVGIGAFIKDSVELEARYSKTMAQMRVATKAPAGELARLDDLAIKLGKETVFSAVDASDAMLELAKNGIKPATIEAGALESALTLAAAGGTGLEDSATAMGNTLNAFRLKGDKAASVAAALAGAANASSASVASLAEGLQQASTVAADTGFNVQETTGILAAFANAGIAGSDAGTSLKTMLSRLVPATAKARDYMKRFGLSFVKSNGEFKGAVEIAQNLKDGLGDLSASERSHALGVIFGSDARRAATILTREGAEGLREYIKATSDQGAAEKMAKANMEGTAGAIERLKGAWETAQLEFGKSIAPVAADFLDILSENIDDVAPKLVEFGEWFADDGVKNIKQFKNFLSDDVVPVLQTLGEFAGDAAGLVGDLVGAFADLPTKDKLAGFTGALAGGLTIKHQFAKIFERGGIGNPMFVTVTNPSFGGGGGLGGAGTGGLAGGAASLGARAGALIRSGFLKAGWVTAGILAADSLWEGFDMDDGRIMTLIDDLLPKDPIVDLPKIIDTVSNQNTTKTQFNGEANPFASLYDPKDPKGTSKRIDAALDATRMKAAGLGQELDLVGDRKVTPLINKQSINDAQDALATFIGLQIDAGRPVAPYINTTSIERAIVLARTLDDALKPHSAPERGVDNGVGFQHGDTGTAPNTRAGVNFNGPITVTAHDYDDFTRQLQRKARTAQRGGRG